MSGNGHKRMSLTRDYYWVCAVVNGRPFVQGWHLTDNDASQWGFSHLTPRGIDFEVNPFRTVDRFSARDKWKNILLERSNQLDTVLSRAKYKL